MLICCAFIPLRSALPLLSSLLLLRCFPASVHDGAGDMMRRRAAGWGGRKCLMVVHEEKWDDPRGIVYRS